MTALLLAFLLGVAACGGADEDTVAQDPATEDMTEDPTEADDDGADSAEATEEPTEADPAEDAEVPDTVRILIGYGPGGSHAIGGELAARHLPKYLPNSPDIHVDYRPGGGSLLAANTGFTTEPQDGSVIVVFDSGVPLQAAMGVEAENVEFHGPDYQWLGSLRQGLVTCFAHSDSEIQSIDELIDGEEFFVSSVGPLSSFSAHANLANHLIGTNFVTVDGYESGSDAMLAVENNEVDGICLPADHSLVQPRIESDPPVLRPLLIAGHERPDHHPIFEGVPLITDYDLTEDDMALLDVLTGPDRMTVPYALGPEVPQGLVEVYEQAFQEMFADPEFVSEFEATGSLFRPNSGSEVQAIVDGVYGVSDEQLEELRGALGL